MKNKKLYFRIFRTILLIIIFLLSYSCKTTEIKSNEMIFNKDKISFSFIINNKNVNGYIESRKGKYDINAKINDNIFVGEMSSFSNRMAYSLIYKNEFVKGNFDYYPDRQSYSVNFQILNKKLYGEIFLMNNNAVLNLVYDNNPLKGNWEYNSKNATIKWNILFNNKESKVMINEKSNKSFYSFNEAIMDDDEIIIFIILETLRMNK